jgi:hypothetical protein
MAKRWWTSKQSSMRLVALATILLLVACSRATPMPAPSTATVAAAPVAPMATVALPTVTAQPATPTFVAGGPTPEAAGTTPGVANGSVTTGAIFTSPRFSYTVILPCCWLALPTPGTAIESAMADLEDGAEIPLWGDLAQRVRERNSGALMELIALLPDDENLALPIAQVTVSVLPTYGLTLDDYATATAAELTRIANTSVQIAYIDPSLGVEEFPAAVIEYTALPTPASAENGEEGIAGLQVAFFGQNAESLIVMTFTTTVDRFAELQPEFLRIVRTITLHDPTI